MSEVRSGGGPVARQISPCLLKVMRRAHVEVAPATSLNSVTERSPRRGQEAVGWPLTPAFLDLNSGVSPDLQLASRPFLTPLPWGKDCAPRLRLAGGAEGLDGGVLIRWQARW